MMRCSSAILLVVRPPDDREEAWAGGLMFTAVRCVIGFVIKIQGLDFQKIL